ncbi:MAG TPA: right-handed parallel beta-helix repeat-containing protein, partial [Fimbriimonadaceae bacterium]|nr:right-handed parallel beta-helix repeat-containing protein [Fimbriimonadaceae bacterium]
VQVAAFFVLLQPKVVLCVAPNGNDAWSGKVAKPNRKGTDGPLATIEAARDRLRKLPESTPAMVEVEPGIYRITAPIVFTPEDSGSGAGDRAYYGSRGAVICGMRRITGWHKLPNGWFQTRVPADWGSEDTTGTVMKTTGETPVPLFGELFVNGERRYRPRLPKQGYDIIADKVAPTDAAKGHGFDRFQFAPGDLRSDWANRDDIEVLAFHYWSMSRNRIGSIDDANHIVTFKAPTGYDADWDSFPKGNRFLVENVKEALTEPGEWYLDRPTHVLTYIPKPGETLAKLDVEAPVAESLIEFRGDPANKTWVSHIVVAGFGLEGTAWNCPPNGRNFPQAEADLSGAVRFTGARDCKLEGCSLDHLGAYAVDIGPACKNVTVAANTMSDLGAGGVKVGEQAWQRDPDLITEHCTVDSNVIEGGGRLHPAAVGVWIGQNPYIKVTGNFIRDLYYTGISDGWSWGYAPDGAHDNLIADNRISMIGQGVLSDMGGIYTLGIQAGTILRGNRIHDVQSFSYGGWGIYPDEGSSHLLIEDNCVFRCKSACVHQHYGEGNTFQNNVFAFGGEAQIMRTRAEDHLSFTMTRNIVYFGDSPLLGSNWTGNEYKLDENLYWRVGGKPFDFAGMTLDQWRAKGQDVDSVVADPLFRDPSHGDFRLEPGSPALKLGFKPFPALDPSFDGGAYRPLPRAFP